MVPFILFHVNCRSYLKFVQIYLRTCVISSDSSLQTLP